MSLHSPKKEPLKLKPKRKAPPPTPPRTPETGMPPDDDPNYRGEPPGEAHPKWNLMEIAKLKPHPKQDKYFERLSQPDLRDLLEDIKKNGLREPVEILPDGTLISGHTRKLIALLLKWSHIPVKIRWELEHASAEEIELALIDANKNRRQLSLLQQAKLFVQRRKLLEAKGEAVPRGKLRDEFAKRLGISGRSLDRLVELVEMPEELQQAVAEKRLSRQAAIDLFKLGPKAYEPFLEKLRKREAVRQEVAKLLLANRRPKEMTETKLSRMLRDWLRTGTYLTTLADRLEDLVLPGHRNALQTIAALAQRLEESLDTRKERQAEAAENLDADAGDDAQDDDDEVDSDEAA